MLVAVITASVFTSYDKAGQFFNSIRSVFADEIEGEGEGENEDSYIIDTEAPDIVETEPSYNEEITESDNNINIEDTTDSSETENVETTVAETDPVETEPAKEDIELKEREVKAEGEDIFVSGLLPSDVRVTAERVEVEVSGVKVIAAYDIKVFDKNGNEWQPIEPLKISVASDEVNKAVEDEAQVIYVPDDLAESGKPVDIKDTNVERIDAVVKDGNVEFQAGHFSVYVIIEHVGGEVVTPRVQFHFIAPVAEDYQPTNNNGLFLYTSNPYTFNNKATDPDAGNKQVSMIVRDGDTLESIEAPLNTQSTYFYGWYTVDKSEDTVTYNSSTKTYSGNITYSWPLNDPGRVELDKAVSISAVRSGDTITSINWTVGNASGTCTDIDSEGCAHVYLAPIYSNYYFVNFHLGAHTESTAETLLSRKLIVLGNSNQTEVKISDVEAPSNDPVHIVFIGWEQNVGTAQDPDWELIRTIDTNNQEIIDPGKDGKYITVGAKTVDLYPYFVQARYINFNIGPSGNGALFLGPQLIFTSDESEGDEYALDSLPTTTRNGFTFGGWYTGPDGTGHQITDAQGVVIDDDYVVKDSNNKKLYEIKDGKIYAYNALDELEFYANWVPNTQATYKVVIWKQKDTDAANIPDDDKTYDYETYYYDENWNTSNPVTEDVLRNFTGSDADRQSVSGVNILGMNYTGFQYGRSEGLGTVDPQGSTVINVYYDRITYSVKFVFARRALSNGSETGNFYVPYLSGSRYTPPATMTWQAYCTQGSGMGWTSANTNQLSLVCSYSSEFVQYEDYNNNRYYFYVITSNYGSDITDLWPDYSKFPTLGNYTLVSWWTMASTSLNEGPGQNDTVKGKFSTMDSTVLGNLNSTNGNFLIASYRTNSNNWTYKIYWETLDGEDYTGMDVVTYNGNTYYLANSFTARSSNTNLSQQNGPEYAGFNAPAKVKGTGTGNIAEFYYTRKSYDLTFSANYPPALAGNQPAEQIFTNITYGQSLASYSSTAAPAVPSSDYVFAGWYEDAGGVKPFDFANETMPSANKVLYAKWSLKEYQININPNGGVICQTDLTWFTAEQLEAIGLTSEDNNPYATYFDNIATQTIQSYDNLVRNYVEVSDAEAAQMDPNDVYRYVYIYRSNLEGGQGKLGAEARVAVYIRDTEASLQAFYDFYVHQVELRQSRDPELTPLPRAQWEATYVSADKYRKLRTGEQYVFLAWYEVVNGVRQNTPFDFSQPAEHETTLIAEWRLDGGYSLLYTTEYYADNNDYITANLEDWTDPLDGTSKYADGATTEAMQEPTSVMVNGKGPEDAEYVDYQFLGWQIVKVETVAGRPRYTPLEPGVYYTAGQDLTVRARYSDENMVIHMQAVYQRRDEAYRRPEVVNLTLNAGRDAMNTAYGTLNGSAGDIPSWAWPGHYYFDVATNSIVFGDTQSNTAIYLYKYATTLSESEVSSDSLNPTGVKFFTHPAGYKLIGFDLDAYDTDFVPDYAADAVVAVSPGDNHILYAVWEPMVYLDLVNDTEKALTISISSTNGNALYVVNQADGSFSRTPVNPNSVVIEPGTTRLVMPYGAGKDFTISGTNTLGVGYVMEVSSTYAGRSSELDPAPVKDIKNTKTYSISDQLYEDAQGRPVTVTFSALQMPRTLVLHDNDPIDATWEQSFDINEATYVLTETRVRVGRVFKGWDESPNATTATYPIENDGSMNQTLILNDFFGENTIKDLYAVWGSNDQEAVVKVYKEVPVPGDQSKGFMFSVNLQGQYRRYSYNSYSTVNETENFELSNGEYLVISMQRNTGGSGNRATLRVAVQKYDANDQPVGSVVYVGWQNNNNNSYNAVNLTRVTVTEIKDDNYTPSIEIVGLYREDYPITSSENPDYKISWTNDRAGGTVVFTNTRRTADVTINKDLLPDTVDPELFSFTAEVVSPANETITYTLDPSTYTILSGADAANGGEWKIEGIPTGSTLIITENLTAADINRFETSAVGIKATASGTSPVTDTAAEDNIFSFVVEDNTTVTFTNTLRTKNIRLVVMDDSIPPEYLDSANFTFPGVFEGTKFSAAGTGLVWEGEVYVGQYDLTETAMPDHAGGVRYTMLQATATVNVNSNGVVVTPGSVSDTILVDYDDVNDVYTIIVINPKMMRVTVKKTVENDYGINSFLFTVVVTDSNDQPVQMSNVYGSQGTNAQGKLEFTLVNNQTALLYVPRYANVQITETEDDRYITAYQTGNSADSLGAAVIGTGTTLMNISSDKYVLCNNQRQKVDVTVEKTLVGSSATFTFTAQLKENNTAVANYTMSNNGTPDDTSDDIVTDASGAATFTLTPATNGTASIVLSVHKGMAINVTEAPSATIAYTTGFSVTSTSDPGNVLKSDQDSNTTGYVTANENITITFTNTEASIVAPTAVKSESMSLVVLMISSATCLAGAVVHNERKKKGGQDVSTND
ncbi:MAG: InlB B-repeat-containing protein [Clostridiales bacterium]|nr:InlB B-repeat-containing protein [Clostridiales bacterium]